MNVYGIISVFEEGELELRKHTGEVTLDGIRALGANLVDETQVYLYIKDEDEKITSIVVRYNSFIAMAQEIIKEVNEIKDKEE